MPDLADAAQAMEGAVDDHIDAIRAQSAVLEVQPTGFCLFCEEVIGTSRWCDAACRDMWEKEREKHAKLEAQARV
jgi:predicted nucleic acid-binding Zn ribbon protein